MQADPADTIDEALLYNPHKAAVSASSIIMFAFTCQVNVPALYDELEQRTPAQMRRVSARAVLIALVFYGAIGVAGYANFPHSHQGNVPFPVPSLYLPCTFPVPSLYLPIGTPTSRTRTRAHPR
jgi:Na+/proline symporter